MKKGSTPKYYIGKFQGLEAFDVCMDFASDSYNIGVAIAYLLRAGKKPDNPKAQDLTKAIAHLQKELEYLNKYGENNDVATSGQPEVNEDKPAVNKSKPTLNAFKPWEYLSTTFGQPKVNGGKPTTNDGATNAINETTGDVRFNWEIYDSKIHNVITVSGAMVTDVVRDIRKNRIIGKINGNTFHWSINGRWSSGLGLRNGNDLILQRKEGLS